MRQASREIISLVGSQLRLPRLIGLTGFMTALLSYASERPRVFNRWSYPAFVAILGAILVWFTATWSSWRGYRALRAVACAEPESRLRPPLDAAMPFSGVGYLLGALGVPSYAGNRSDLNLFGSTTPVTIALYMVFPRGTRPRSSYLATVATCRAMGELGSREVHDK
jgi:hypothetical protein